MTFFSPEKLKRRRIEIDESSVCSKSADVQKRLNRIEANYKELDDILVDLEARIKADERLNAIDDANVDFEATFGVKKKRKWNPAKPKSKTKRRRTASADPKKPR